jgi:hypothetical protein
MERLNRIIPKIGRAYFGANVQAHIRSSYPTVKGATDALSS